MSTVQGRNVCLSSLLVYRKSGAHAEYEGPTKLFKLTWLDSFTVVLVCRRRRRKVVSGKCYVTGMLKRFITAIPYSSLCFMDVCSSLCVSSCDGGCLTQLVKYLAYCLNSDF